MLSLDEKISFLARVPSFRRLKPAQTRKLANLCREEFYLAGDQFFNQSEANETLFIIVEGRVVLERKIGGKSDTVSLNVVQSGDSFGEISLFYNVPWSVKATATRPTTVLRLRHDDFSAFIDDHPELLDALNSAINQRLAEANVKISEITWGKKPHQAQKLYEKLSF